MELLLALAGLGGLALLLQQKPVPSEADAEKALDKLDQDPDDPEANLVAGKFQAFVLGNYEKAMPYLALSKDSTLKALAERELDISKTVTADQKVEMGDEWVKASRKFAPLRKAFYDRASYWYAEAWNLLDGLDKVRLRQRLQSIHQNVQAGDARGAVAPRPWRIIDQNQKAQVTQRAPRTGTKSFQVSPADKNQAEFTSLEQMIPVTPGKKLEISAMGLTDGNDGIDYVSFVTFGQGGKMTGVKSLTFAPDEPWWHQAKTELMVPAESNILVVHVASRSKKGNFFVDDISVKDGITELVKNPSFEDR